MDTDPTAEATRNQRRAFLLGAVPIVAALGLMVAAAMVFDTFAEGDLARAPAIDLDAEGAPFPVVRGDPNRPDAGPSRVEAVLGGEEGAGEDSKAKIFSNPLLQRVGEGSLFDPSAVDLGDDRVATLGEAAGPRSRSMDVAAQDIDDLAPVAPATAGVAAPLLEVSGAGGAVMAVREASPPLTDPESVRQHVQDVMTQRLPTLRACYEQRLKVRESLEGDWRLDFVVSSGGTVEEVRVAGQQVKDAEFESCLTRQIERWTFRPIGAAQPVGRSVTFQPLF